MVFKEYSKSYFLNLNFSSYGKKKNQEKMIFVFIFNDVVLSQSAPKNVFIPKHLYSQFNYTHKYQENYPIFNNCEKGLKVEFLVYELFKSSG